MKRNRWQQRPAIDYGPTPTSLVSGDVERDAEYVLALPTKPRRQHEIWRLEQIQGINHRLAVERRVMEIWNEKRNAERTN
jgi:hypothetical protein